MNQRDFVSQVAEALSRMPRDVETEWSHGDDGADRALAIAPSYRLEIYIDTTRAVSLEFTAASQLGDSRPLHYVIDTDLYDIAQAKYERYSQAVGDQIVEFLNALAAGKVCLGTFNGRSAMVIPTNSRAVLVYKGRFATITRHMSAKDKGRVADMRSIYDTGPAT